MYITSEQSHHLSRANPVELIRLAIRGLNA